MNSKTKKISDSVFNKIVAVVTALSLVFLQVPISTITAGARAEAANEAKERAAEETSIDVPLSFDNAYIIYDDQVIAEPATKVTLPSDTAMEFTAEADSGYQLESVTATIDGTEIELSPNGAGDYKLSADEVAVTDEIAVYAITAPTVEDVEVEADEDEDEEAADEEQAEADEATDANSTVTDEVAADADESDAGAEKVASSSASSSSSAASETEESSSSSAVASSSSSSSSSSSKSSSSSADSEKKNTETEFTYSDSDAEVTATLSRADAIPAGATFKVTRVTASTKGYSYDAYLEALNDDADEDVEYTSDNTLLYDVAFMVENDEGDLVEYEPESGTVAISIKFKKDQLADGIEATQAADVEIKHLALKADVRDEVDSTADATDIEASDIIVEDAKKATVALDSEEVNFTLDSLSIVAVSNASTLSATSTSAATTPTATASQATASSTSGGVTAIDSSNATIEFGVYQSSTDRANRTNELTSDDEIAISDMLYGLVRYDFKTGEGPTTGRLTYTYTLPDSLDVRDKAATTLYDDNYNVAGTWEIKDGVVYFYYDETWAKKHPDGGGFFSFDFQLVEDKTETGKDATFSFPGASTTVTIKVAAGDLTGSKTNTGIDSEGYVTYTVNLHAQQDFPYFQFTDKLDSSLEYVSGSFTIDGKPMSVTMTENSNGSTTATASASSISKGDHVITYRAKIDQDTFSKLSNWGSISANNIATWKFGDNADNPNSHYATSYVWAQKNLINKTNGGVSSDGTVTWTVTINGSALKSDVSGYTFTDTLGSGQKYTGTYQVLDSNWRVVSTGNVDKNATSFTYTFPSNAGANTYYIKYTTKLDDTSQQNTVKNTGTITPPGGTPTKSDNEVTYYPPSSGGNSGSGSSGGGTSTTAPSNLGVTKEVLDSSQATTTGLVSWHSTITVNNWPSENAGYLEFYDDTWNYGNNKGAGNDGYASLWHTGTPTLSAGGVALVEGVDYEFIDPSKNVVSMGTTTQKNYAGETVDEGFLIRFNTDSDAMKSVISNHTPIDVYYTTMCDGSYTTYTNTAFVCRSMTWWGADVQSARANYTIEGNPKVLKDNAWMYLDRDRGKWVAEWTIKVNYNNNNVIGDLASPTVRVIDTLPEGMSYIAGSATSSFVRTSSSYSDYWATDDSTYPAYAPTVSQDGSALTFEYDFSQKYDRKDQWQRYESMATQLADGSWSNQTYIVLKFKTELSSDYVVRDGSTQTLYNTATADAGGVSLGTAHAKATYTDNVIEKVGKQDGESPVVHYTITVNKGGEKLDPEDSHTAITLNDKLDAKSTVILSSIKVTNLDTNEDISDSCPISYDASAVDADGNPTTAFSVTIPDSTPVNIEYNVLLSGSVGEQVDITNTASLEGLTSKETKTQNRYEVRQADAGVYGSAVKISITKSDADDVVNKQLSGAEFTLYRVDMSKLPNGAPTDAQLAAASTTIYVGTTNESGVVYLGERDGNELALSSDTLYYFKETKAPAGYELDSTVRYVMVKGNDYDSQLAIAKSHDITPSQVVVYNAVDKEEEKVTTIDISGTKTWDDQNDRDRMRPTSIKVNLLANGTKVAEQTVTPDADGNWTYTFAEQPKTDSNGDITYTVSEDTVAGYTATVNGYNITNKHKLEKVSVSGKKVWNDADDQDGIRPDAVTVSLLANGKDTGKTVQATKDNGWKFSFADLDKNDSNGNAIAYTVKEAEVNGYKSTVTGSMAAGFTITNTYTPETIEIPVKKIWDDADNQDGVRLTQVYAQLYADGVAVDGKKVQLKEANGWYNKFTDLPKYSNGKEIVYTVKESTTVSPNYEKSVTGNAAIGFTITNKHTPTTTTVSGTKSWNDFCDAFGDRPSSITVHLLADGKEYKTTTATAEKGWTYEFTDLPVYKKGSVGQKVVYTIAESSFTDYITAVSGTDLVNTLNPETTSVTVTKAWDDADNEDGVRPESIKVKLWLNDTISNEVELTAANGWTYTWSDLPKHYKGGDAVYTVTEDLPAGYDSYEVTGDAANGYTITNKRTVTPSTQLSIIKLSAANASKPLANAKFTLTPVDPAGEARTGTTSDYGVLVFDKLKKGASYTLEETAAPGGFKRDTTVYHFTVGTDDKMTIKFAESDMEVYYNQSGNYYYMGFYDQPDSGYGSILLHKNVNGVDGLWGDASAHPEINTVRTNIAIHVENTSTGDYFDFTGIGRMGQNNRYVTLYDKSGNSIGQVQVVAKGSFDSQINNLPSGTWKVTETADGLTGFSGVNAAKSGAGDTYVRTTTYSVNGDATQLIGTSSSDPQTLTIDDTYYNKGSLVLTKEFGWDYTGLPGQYAGNKLGEAATNTILAGITFTLTAQSTGETYTIKGNDFSSKQITSKSGNTTITVGYYNRQWTITNLPYDTYTVVEESDGYCDETSEVDTILHKFYTTGTFAVGKDSKTTNVSVGDTTGVRGADTVSEESATVDVSGADATMNVLNVYYRPKAIEVTKTWEIPDGLDYTPGDIVVQLVRSVNGVDNAGEWQQGYFRAVTEGDVPEHPGYVTKKTLHWNNATKSYDTVTFTNLPAVTANGEQITYEVREVAADGSLVEMVNGKYTDSNGNVLTEGNTYIDKTGATATATWGAGWTPAKDPYTEEDGTEQYYSSAKGLTIHNKMESTEVSGKKTWSDANDQDGMRPSKVTVNLLANGEKVASKEVTADDDWAYSFKGLPKYSKGEEIVYTVSEDEVPGYTAQVSGANITNVHTPVKTSVKVTKTWKDGDNQDGIRPKSITVNLWNGDTKVASKTVKADSNGVWACEFTGLDKYAGGKEIEYSVTEETVPGYTAQISGTNITNTHTPEEIEVSGTKTWVDDNNQDGLRPEAITVHLLANDKEIASQEVEVNSDGTWAYSFGMLPKYENGTAIAYTVTEDAVEGYAAVVNGTSVTNTHTSKKISVSGTKTWDDNNDQDGLRPETITVHLLADGEQVDTKTVRANADGTWTYEFTGLNAFSDGQPIAYTVSEEPVKGYTPTYNGMDIVNTHKPATTSAVAAKVWDDNDDQDGLRPDRITVRLLANGVEKETRTIAPDANGVWPQATFTELPVYENGKKITYTVTEDEVKGYTTNKASFVGSLGTVFTNTHETTEKSVSGTKVWNDSDNQDGKRPSSITVHLLADNVEIDSQTVTAAADGTWSYSFDNLPVYKDHGTEIVYTVSEDEVAGYTTAIDGADITNTHPPEKTSVKVVKNWNDGNDHDGLRPNAVTVQLYADNEASGAPVTLDESTDWEYTWSDLPKYSGGTEIVYTVAEVGSGNTTAYTTSAPTWDEAQNAFVITNTHEVVPVTVSGTKTWSDANDQDGARPASITVNLLANGSKVKEQSVLPDDEGNWTFTFDNLDRYADGTEIEYTVSEEAIKDYTATITGDAATGFTIDNKHTPEKTSVTVTKAWDDADDQDGLRPSSIQVNLMAGGEVKGTATLNEANKWTCTWNDLDRYAGGEEIAYTIEEPELDGYTTALTGSVTGGFTLKNTHTPEKVDVKVDKVWDDANNQDGKRAEGVEVELKAAANGEAVVLEGVATRVTLNDANEWHYEWADLPAKHNGADIVYSLAEVTVSSDYETSVTTSTTAATDDANASIAFTVSNEHAPEYVSLSGKKTWEDADNQDGLRPDTITVRLWNGDTEVASTTATAASGWVYTFDDQPKYANGSEIVYTVTEDTVPGYRATVNGLDIVNVHTPEKTKVSGAKTWQDGDDRDGKRPESITVRVWNGETEVASKSVTPDASGNWSYEITGLDKYADGDEIVYTVTEDAVTGYSTVVEGYDITNSYIPEVTSVAGEKIWDDADNQDGKRPASVTVNLLADGEVIQSKEVTAADDWKYSFTNLPTNRDHGVKIVYTVSENAVAGYTTAIDGYDITNSYTPETTSISGEKTWEDANNQDNIRPTSIVVKAMDGDRVVATKTVSPDAKGDWKYEFDNLPKYADAGREISYTVAEEPVAGYTATVSGANIVNEHETEKTEVSGVKTWVDSDNQDGKRPESVTVRLWNGETEVDHKEVTAADNWTFTFTNLEKNANGTEINYTITEDEVEGYTTDVTGYAITNSYTPETTKVSGVKIWDDDNDRDNVRPSSITVNLLANGEKIDSQEVAAAEDGTWSYSFDNLPAYENGRKIAYSVTEDAVSGYETTYNGYNIVNKHELERVSVSGTKTWEDANNQDGKRPSSITVRLWNGTTEVKSQEVTPDEDGNWSYSFDNLLKKENGQPINYTITEDAVTGYTAEVNGFDVKNTHTPETTSVSGTKTWADANNQDGKRPESITVRLWKGGVESDSKVVTVGEDGTWSYSFDNLPAYENGVKLSYSVTEDTVAEYTTSYNGDDIVNTHTPEKKSVSGTKTWEDANNQDGKRPTRITVNLLADGEQTDTRVLTPDAEGNWPSYTFTDLPVYKNGSTIEYTVSEDVVSDYATEVSGTSITNTHEVEKTSISGTKTWADNNNQDGKRPASVTVNLLENGTKVASKSVTAADNWAYSFTELPVYKNGSKITYSITEDAVANYETSIDGYDVTNTHQPEKTEMTVVKAWNDENDYDGLRPDAVKVQLYADGAPQGEAVTLNATLGWTYTWTGLDKYKAGNEIAYTVAEVDNGNTTAYTASAPAYNAAHTSATITNTHVPEKVNVGGKKTWSDANNQDGKRPSSITVDLLANGAKVQSKVVTAGENGVWAFSFENLDKYQNGKAITYTVTEEEVEGYTATITGDATTGFTIDNAYTPEETQVKVTKEWDDADNQDGIRAGSVKVRLLADGTQVEAEGVTSEVELNADNNWTYTWTGLDRYANGTEIVYSVEEDTVADYSAELTGSATAGFTLKNTHAPTLVDVKVDKDWNDASNQDGKRAGSIDVQLNATVDGAPITIDGAETTATLNEANSWHYEWKNLPQKRDGKVIVYTLAEVGGIDGYTSSVTSDQTAATATANAITTFTIANDHTPERIDIPVAKSWNDANDQDGKRPATITVQLFAGDDPVLENGAPVTAVLNADNDWAATFEDLPKYANGSEVAYKVVETAVPADYEKDADGTKANDYTLANAHETEKVSATAKKVWDDASNQDGKRGTFVTVELRADGEVVKTGTLNADNNWAVQWNDLPKYANGSVIDYTLTEADASVPEGYTASVAKSVDGNSIAFTATNTHVPEETSVSGAKTWSDANDQDGKRPSTITVNLLADGVKVDSKTVTADENGDWEYSFTGLAKYKNGAEIVYSVSEDTVDGYTTTVDGYDITNSYKPGETSVAVTKAWNDADDQDRVRPVAVKVQLYADGNAKGEAVALSAANGWAYTWEGLPQKSAGKDIAYTVAEVEGDWSANYTTAKAGNASDGYVITNTHKPEETSAKVTKVWNDANNQDGKRADGIEVQLLANGAAYGAPVTLDERNHWTFNWTELPKKSAGVDIAYTLAEVSETTGYATEVTQSDFEFTVTNSHDVELIDIPVTKTWNDANNQDGVRPASVTVKLMNGDAEVGTLELNAGNNWSGTFADLPKYDNGHEITYTLQEVSVENYTSEITGSRTEGFEVSNTHTPEVTTAKVTKVWNDANNQDGKRSDEITVQLLSNDGAYGDPVVLSAENGWTYEWTNLPKYANAGQEISYTVTESGAPADYTAAITGDRATGYTITNSYTPGVRDITVSKAWEDKQNQDGLRPDFVKVRLLADGSQIDVEGVAAEVELNAGNNWTYTWSNLDQMKAGRTIAYTVEEVDVPQGYNATTAGSADEGYVITNQHTPETTSIEASKEWNDDDNRDGLRPEGVTLILYADGEQVATENVTADARGNWSYTFEDLPKYANAGEEIVYTIGEAPIDGYAGTFDGLTATNTHENAKVSVSGSKTWIDADNVKGLRPDKITVNLLADGVKVDSQEVTAENNWAYSFTDLNKYRDAGAPIAYTVTEDAVENYTTTVDGYNITNKLIPREQVEFFAAKTLEGRTLSADEFSFELLEDDEVLQTVSNAGDGHARFDAITYTLDDLGAHSYTIREVVGNVPGVAYDTTEHNFSTTVTDNGNGTLSVAYDGYDPAAGASFTNTYTPSGSTELEVVKLVDGNKPAVAGAYTFQLADAQGNVYATATNDADGIVKFPALNFKAAGKYAYRITEVLPNDVKYLNGIPVADNVAYDTRVITATIEAIDNFDGTLRFTTSYNGNVSDEVELATFNNTSVPEVSYPLAATKAVEGRDFQPGDSFTFTVSADDADAPLPDRTSVTIEPTSGTTAPVNFGDVTFTTDDLGKTYTYTITEANSGETSDGLTNDPFSHWVKLTVGDAGDGTMSVIAEYQNEADQVAVTNTYAATGEATITATKVLEGRDLADNEFFFKLSGESLPGDLTAHAAADGTVTFPAIRFTQADAGKDFTYTMTEVQGTLGGVTYDESSYDVTVHVADNGDGTLSFTYDYGEGSEPPVFRNAYRAEGTSVALTAHKALVGGKLEGGEFSFTLTGTSANAEGTQQTKQNAADGTVTFDAIDYDATGTYEYTVAEVIPAGATDNGNGTFTSADGVVYDATEHTAVVTVTDNGVGQLVASVAYDGGEADGISFGNTALARTGFTFNKYYFGGVGTFDFTLTAADAEGNARAGELVDYSDAATIVDDGVRALTATVQNGAFNDGVAEVVFPEISYVGDGDYYYLVEEATESSSAMTADSAKYLVHVTVAGGNVTGTTFDLLYEGENLGSTDDLSFYNNSKVTLGFNSLAALGFTESAERVSVYPEAKKYLNDSTDQLVGGEFTFELSDDETGAVLAVATNDEFGNIAFFDEQNDPGLAYDEPGTFNYTIREVAGDDAGIIYDDSVVELTVSVTEGADGLEATMTYNGPGGGEPAFYNVKEGMDITVQKISREGGEGLEGSTYALWMVGDNGDVLVQEAVSDADGYITFTDVSLIAGQKYYFKEVAAPSGHTVDPHRTAYFALNATGDKLVLVEKTASDGWHSATETKN